MKRQSHFLKLWENLENATVVLKEKFQYISPSDESKYAFTFKVDAILVKRKKYIYTNCS